MLNHPIYIYLFTYVHEALKILKMRMPPEKQASFQLEMVAHYFVSAFIGTLKWWVDKDMPCAAEEVNKLFTQIAMHGFKDVLGLS